MPETTWRSTPRLAMGIHALCDMRTGCGSYHGGWRKRGNWCRAVCNRLSDDVRSSPLRKSLIFLLKTVIVDQSLPKLMILCVILFYINTLCRVTC